ncbi:glycoside hydrolase family 16 protein [Pseudonocardia charpentierae]|uniref:Family 16 glycosylhydrolase n=1 Tax=Pseudonocardia charpentierae TaxID=3075545 RepID=A0ABU2N9G7_9PSEU|nr:family 16 glycosylhydrolase [Pseudonocardia sp. DSM 45834]MDT0349934.1 family 16 glycosylhydrolase [Pseudonocardia sp. DSM 45834]
MVGGLEALRRVAAVGLLALGSVVPHNGPFLTAPPDVTPVADTSLACLLTVGTATTDPALATSAARAIAVGYAATDCMPDEQLLAAAEARAAIPMDTGTPTESATGGVLAGTSSGSTSVATTSSSATVTPTPSPSATTTATATAADATVAASSTDTATATGTVGADDSSSSGDDDSSSGSSSSGSSSSGSSSSGSSGGDFDSDDTVDPSTSVDPNPIDPNPVDPAPVDPAPVDPNPIDPTTAAGALAWGAAAGVEDFDGTLSNWGVYDGAGHAGKGRRSPAAVNASGGILTITGDPDGTTGGMAWKLGRAKYGRWEARVKAPAADPSYHAVMLLWPDAENWPVGGEVDFMEISDPARQKTDFFLHYGQDSRQLRGEKVIDATQWHNWAVEWSPTKITAYVDGTEWFSTTQVDAFPPGSMHLTLQLDWFPKGGAAATPSQMLVDWVRYYPIEGTGPSDLIQNSSDVAANAGVALSSIAGTGTGETLTGDTVQSGPTDAATGNDSSDPTPTTVANARTTAITAPAEPTAVSSSEAAAGSALPVTVTNSSTTSPTDEG